MTASTRTPKKAGSKPPAKKTAKSPGATPKTAVATKASGTRKTAAATRESAKPTQARSRMKRKAPTPISPEQRRAYVEVAAYYIAERRGFAPGDSIQDWTQAEAEIDRLLLAGMLGKLAGD